MHCSLYLITYTPLNQSDTSIHNCQKLQSDRPKMIPTEGVKIFTLEKFPTQGTH